VKVLENSTIDQLLTSKNAFSLDRIKQKINLEKFMINGGKINKIEK